MWLLFSFSSTVETFENILAFFLSIVLVYLEFPLLRNMESTSPFVLSVLVVLGVQMRLLIIPLMGNMTLHPLLSESLPFSTLLI